MRFFPHPRRFCRKPVPSLQHFSSEEQQKGGPKRGKRATDSSRRHSARSGRSAPEVHRSRRRRRISASKSFRSLRVFSPVPPACGEYPPTVQTEGELSAAFSPRSVPRISGSAGEMLVEGFRGGDVSQNSSSLRSSS
jgi:hypothetical protein